MERPKFKSYSYNFYNDDADFYEKDQVDAYLDKLFAGAVRVVGENNNWFVEGYVTATRLIHPRPLTHQALLVGISEIQPKSCEHEPIEMVLTPGNGTITVKYTNETTCKSCGKKLKAKWSVAE